MKYRHEYKYRVTVAELLMVRQRIASLLALDPHIATDGRWKGRYNIRSVDFDDPQNSGYYDNENGTDPRKKWRIRIYNHSSERIALELKAKRQGMCLKQSCTLERPLCEALLKATPPAPSSTMPPLLCQFITEMQTRQLRPVVVVEYDRIPYIYALGNVRVTMDCNIAASAACDKFFNDDLPLRPILPKAEHILEVKWDELLPDHIYHALMLEGLQWTNFSKFYLCRRLTK